MYDLHDLYETLIHADFGDVLDVYEKVRDFSNTKDKKLLELYNRQLEYVYEEKKEVNDLDFAQMEWMKEVVEKVILRRI